MSILRRKPGKPAKYKKPAPSYKDIRMQYADEESHTIFHEFANILRTAFRSPDDPSRITEEVMADLNHRNVVSLPDYPLRRNIATKPREVEWGYIDMEGKCIPASRFRPECDYVLHECVKERKNYHFLCNVDLDDDSMWYLYNAAEWIDNPSCRTDLWKIAQCNILSEHMIDVMCYSLCCGICLPDIIRVDRLSEDDWYNLFDEIRCRLEYSNADSLMYFLYGDIGIETGKKFRDLFDNPAWKL